MILLLSFAFADEGAPSGPPLIGDDPGTPGPGNWEINVATQINQSAAGTELQVPLLDMNYGVGERIQIAYSIAYDLEMENGETEGMLSDSELGLKIRYLDTGAFGLTGSIYPKLLFPRNGGAQAVNTVEIPAEFSWVLGKWTLGLDGGYDLPIKGQSKVAGEQGWFGGIAGGYIVNDRFQLLAEAHAEGGKEETELMLNGGARYAATSWLNLLFSAGHSVVSVKTDPELMGYLALQFVSG